MGTLRQGYETLGGRPDGVGTDNLLPSDEAILEDCTRLALSGGRVGAAAFLHDRSDLQSGSTRNILLHVAGFFGLALFLLGGKGIGDAAPSIRSDWEMLAVGGSATGVAYGVGRCLKDWDRVKGGFVELFSDFPAAEGRTAEEKLFPVCNWPSLSSRRQLTSGIL